MAKKTNPEILRSALLLLSEPIKADGDSKAFFFPPSSLRSLQSLKQLNDVCVLACVCGD